MQTLLDRPFWVFDLDGTLTEPIHDFDAIRRDLGIPIGRPILEALASFPPDRAERLHKRLLDIEWDLAEHAVPAQDAPRLVHMLRGRGARVGVLTRNDRAIAVRTLEVIGLADVFGADVLGRDDAAIKPAPDGILALLARWGGSPGAAVMVGDTAYDARAGRAAGACTVLVAPSLPESLAEAVDVHVAFLGALLGQE